MLDLLLRIMKSVFVRMGYQIKPYRDQFKDMRKLLADDNVEVVVDGGAYIGQIAERLARTFPEAEVYAFEPQQKAFKVLCERMQNSYCL